MTEIRHWFRYRPCFAITGSLYSQPLGGLAGDFFADDCGSLDAPQYIPIGGMRASAWLSSFDGAPMAQEFATVTRDILRSDRP